MRIDADLAISILFQISNGMTKKDNKWLECKLQKLLEVVVKNAS